LFGGLKTAALAVQHSKLDNQDMYEPVVVIAMVSYRDPALIVRALRALDLSNYRKFTVVIVENGGPKAYESLAEALAEAFTRSGRHVTASGRVTTIDHFVLGGGEQILCCEAEDNVGYAGGVNIACEQASVIFDRPEALWVLNPDTRPDPRALGEMVSYAQTTGHAMIGCRLVLSASNTIQLYGGVWRSWLARGFNIGLGAAADAKPDIGAVEAAMSYVSGASMFVTRQFMDLVGPMPERYFLYCEEVDWCLGRGELTLGYAHDAVVVHDHGATIGSNISRKARSPLSVYLDERNRMLLTRKYFPARLAVSFGVSVLFLGKYAAAGAWRNMVFGLRGLVAGLRGEDGKPRLFFPGLSSRSMP
jgi:N-acetylglucosaminyl-diphospho-decaprenol L-rhamnosyltransferase